MKKSLIVIGIALISLVFTACRSDIVYTQFFPISSGQWHMDSVVHFEYRIADTDADYRMLIYVRHTERYPYQNMWLFVGDSLHRDTIEFYLADDRGQWLGDKHHGFVEMPVLYETDYHYADTGRYDLIVQHGMRDSVLRGITDIGVEIIKCKNE